MKSRSHNIWAKCRNYCHSVTAQALSGYTGGIIDDFKSMSPLICLIFTLCIQNKTKNQAHSLHENILSSQKEIWKELQR